MKVVVIWKDESWVQLFEWINEVVEELGLNEFVKPELLKEESEINSYKENVEVTKEPALIIEEESIDFKDVIFEGFIPEKHELSQMFVSIIGWAETGWGCSSDGWCGSCSSAWSCSI